MSQITPAQQIFDLTGEVALVTGASSGLGRRFAEVLAAHGAKVVAAARRSDRLQQLAGAGGTIAPLTLDVTDTQSFGTALDEAEQAFGPLTLLVNNAGVAGGGRIVDTPEAEYARVMATNVDAVWHLSRAFAQRLIARQQAGSVINIASLVAGRVGMSSAGSAVSKASASTPSRPATSRAR